MTVSVERIELHVLNTHPRLALKQVSIDNAAINLLLMGD